MKDIDTLIERSRIMLAVVSRNEAVTALVSAGAPIELAFLAVTAAVLLEMP